MELCEFNIKLMFLIVIFFAYGVLGDGGEICTPLNGVERTCTRYEDCPKEIRDLVKMKNRPANLTKLLKDSICNRRLKKLCCPMPECYTWDGRPGKCVKFNENQDLFPADITYRQIKVSACKKIDMKGDTICYSDLPIHQTGDCESDKSAFPPDPTYGCCGQERSINRVVGGRHPNIDQFPWIALLKYWNDEKSCTGALISGKYVLTAARCVTDLEPYAVVFGEYDKSKAVDCDTEDECGDPPLTVLIESVLVHPQLNRRTTPWRNDVAVIRLRTMVPYTDFILPICLPIDYYDATNKTDIEFRLEATGWGSADTGSHRPSNVKMMVGLPFVNRTECLAHHPTLSKRQMCAGGDPNTDSCIGDPGSPLMNNRIGTYEVIGIASYDNTAKCGQDGKPDIYAKVHSYIQWIHSTIRP